MKQVIFVGLNPSKLKIPRKGGAWDRFCYWLNVLGIDIVTFTNISPDEDFKGKNIDEDFLKQSLEGYDKIIAWGPSVSKHLKRINIDHFTIPHPSPLNRQINDKDFIQEKLKQCREYIYE